MRELEPLSFDRALRDAAREFDRRKRAFESQSDVLPEYMRDEETLHWLRESRAKDPLAHSLELWLLRLREQTHFGARRAELSRAHQSELHPIAEPERIQLPLAEMLRLSLTRPRERAAYLRSFFASCAGLGELVRRLWEERLMFAETVAAPLDSFEVASPSTLALARTFVAETESAFESLHIHEPAQLLTTLLAESATEGWPARLSARSTLDLLGDAVWTHGLRVRPFAVPTAYGASSFLLALAEAGRAISDAASALRSPFVLATDVFDLRRHAFGALLAMLPLSPTFASRRLGLGPSRVQDQQRLLARAILAELRVASFRVLLRELLTGSASRLRSELPEVSDGALGFELPLEVAGAFIRVRARDSQRFAGALLAAGRYELLLQTHDEDWFRNPRAIAELRAELGEPAPSLPSTEALSGGARALVTRIQALL
jgi:hypothetical protein